jgi:hypothetical protein
MLASGYLFGVPGYPATGCWAAGLVVPYFLFALLTLEL